MTISRRELITGAAAVAVGSALETRRSWAGSEEVDCVVVGTGLAGLYSAVTLTDGGASTLLLDSADHVGGRCRTAYEWDSRIELGGVQIGLLYARVRYMAARFSIPLGEGAHINAPYSFVIDDELIPAGKWASSSRNRTTGDERVVPPHALGSYYVERLNPFQQLDDWLKPTAAEFDVSVAQWLDKQGASEAARKLIRESRGGDSLKSLSLLRQFQEATYYRFSTQQVKAGVLADKRDVFERSAETSLHVEGGVSRLTRAMAGFLGDRVRLGHQVVSVEMDDRGCDVRCANGARFRGKTVIMAVPFSVLRDIRINPPLEGAQADAVRRMPYGNQSQVWLRVKAPYWEDDGIEASMFTDGPFTLIRQQLEYDGKRELMSCLAFGGKSVPVDALPPADRGRLAISLIEKVRPSTRGKLEFIGAQSWAENPHERGCSHSFVPGRGFDWAMNMARPHHRAHFAGEHLRRMEVGMEAAMESGEIAALGVLEQLG